MGNKSIAEQLLIAWENESDLETSSFILEALEKTGTPEALAAVEAWRAKQEKAEGLYSFMMSPRVKV